MAHELEGASKSTVAAIRALQEKIRRLEHENFDLRSNLLSLQNALETQAVRRSDDERDQRAAVEQHKRQLQARIQQLEQEVAHVSQLREEAISQVQASVNERLSLWSADEARLRSDIELYRSEMLRARAEAEEYARQIATYRAKAETGERGRVEAESHLQSAVLDACSPLEARLRVVQGDLEHKTEECAQWKAQTEQLAVKLHSTLEQLQAAQTAPANNASFASLDASAVMSTRSLQDVAEGRARQLLNASQQQQNRREATQALNASVFSRSSIGSVPTLAPGSPPRPSMAAHEPYLHVADTGGSPRRLRTDPVAAHTQRAGAPVPSRIHAKLQTAYLGGPVPFLPPSRGSSRPGDLRTMERDRILRPPPSHDAEGTAQGSTETRRGRRSSSPARSLADMGRSMRSSNLLATVQSSYHQQKLLGAHSVGFSSQASTGTHSAHALPLHTAGMPALPDSRVRSRASSVARSKHVKPPVPRFGSSQVQQRDHKRMDLAIDATEAALQAAARAVRAALDLRHAEKGAVSLSSGGDGRAQSRDRRASVLQALHVLQQQEGST